MTTPLTPRQVAWLQNRHVLAQAKAEGEQAVALVQLLADVSTQAELAELVAYLNGLLPDRVQRHLQPAEG